MAAGGLPLLQGTPDNSSSLAGIVYQASVLPHSGAGLSSRWRVFSFPGFAQRTRDGRRLVRVPPIATAGFRRTHLPTSVLPANRHLVSFSVAAPSAFQDKA